MLDVASPSAARDVPRASLAYWVAANRLAVERGRALLGDRFLLLNYNHLCTGPAVGLEVLSTFLGVPLSREKRDLLGAIPKVHPSTGRYKLHDLSQFSREDLHSVREFGFEIDASS